MRLEIIDSLEANENVTEKGRSDIDKGDNQAVLNQILMHRIVTAQGENRGSTFVDNLQEALSIAGVGLKESSAQGLLMWRNIRLIN